MGKGLGRTQVEVLEAVRRLEARCNGNWLEPWQIANELRSMRGLPDRGQISRQRAIDDRRIDAELRAALESGSPAERKEAADLIAMRDVVSMLAANMGRGQRSDDSGYSASVGLSRVIAKLVKRGLLIKDGGRGRAFVRSATV